MQTLHIGSCDDEALVLAAMHHGFIPAHGMRMTGRHHEIYLSDPPTHRGSAAQDDPAPARCSGG